MSIQREFDLSLWERFRDRPEVRCAMVEIEDLCIELAGFRVQDIPHQKELLERLAAKVAGLPDEIRPAELGHYVLYLWATLMATRLRQRSKMS